MPTPPDCYKCEHRGSVPGDAHSRCNHPMIKQDNNSAAALFDMICGISKKAERELKIKGNSHGIAKG